MESDETWKNSSTHRFGHDSGGPEAARDFVDIARERPQPLRLGHRLGVRLDTVDGKNLGVNIFEPPGPRAHPGHSGPGFQWGPQGSIGVIRGPGGPEAIGRYRKHSEDFGSPPLVTGFDVLSIYCPYTVHNRCGLFGGNMATGQLETRGRID